MTEPVRVDEGATKLPKLLPCPFCGTHPHHGLTKVEYDQLHGEPFQRFRVWCPNQCASKTAADQRRATEIWNTRANLPTPVPPVEGLVERLAQILFDSESADLKDEISWGRALELAKEIIASGLLQSRDEVLEEAAKVVRAAGLAYAQEVANGTAADFIQPSEGVRRDAFAVAANVVAAIEKAIRALKSTPIQTGE